MQQFFLSEPGDIQKTLGIDPDLNWESSEEQLISQKST